METHIVKMFVVLIALLISSSAWADNTPDDWHISGIVKMGFAKDKLILLINGKEVAKGKIGSIAQQTTLNGKYQGGCPKSS